MTYRGPRILSGVTIDYQLRYHEGLWDVLVQEGWEVHLVATSGANLKAAARSLQARVTTHSLSMARDPSPVKDLLGLLKWIRLIKKVDPAVVLVGTPKASFLGMLAGAICKVPHRIYEVHGLRLEGSTGLSKWILSGLEKVTSALATQVVPVSYSLEHQLKAKKLTPPQKLKVLGAGSPNGVDVEHFKAARIRDLDAEALRAQLGISESSRVVVFVGRLHEDKGIASLRAAMAELIRTINIHLLIVGPVDDERGNEWLSAFRESGIPHTVTGEVTDVTPFLAVANVLCLPSRREGLPTVVLEAFASSLPVVATAATGIVDLVDHNQTGLLVPVDDSKRLADEVRRVLADDELATKLAANALKLVNRDYRRESVQARWSEYLNSLLDS